MARRPARGPEVKSQLRVNRFTFVRIRARGIWDSGAKYFSQVSPSFANELHLLITEIGGQLIKDTLSTTLPRLLFNDGL